MRRLLAGVLVLVGAVAGCSIGPGPTRAAPEQALGTIEQAVSEASSAVATTREALALWRHGDLAGVTADVAVGDATSTAAGAAGDLAVVVVPDAPTLAVRDAALAEVQRATIAVAGARTWIAGGMSDEQGSGLTASLADGARRLDAIDAQVRDARASRR